MINHDKLHNKHTPKMPSLVKNYTDNKNNLLNIASYSSQ